VDPRVIGHMPDLGGASPGTVHFAKAGAACIRFEADPARAEGELLWLVSPE
jgi:hypothetical protein